MIKVIVADDQELIRQSLAIVLNLDEKIEVLDTVANGNEVIESVKREKPDVILMDIRMPELDGVICTKYIKENYPDIKIIILTTFDDDEYVFNALRYGASGYLLKGTSTEDLIRAIEKVYNGTAMINEDIASKVLKFFKNITNPKLFITVDSQKAHKLTEAEIEVIKFLEQGYSNKEIAEQLYLSNGTVRNMISSILSKLGLRDRTQLAIWAIQSDFMNLNAQRIKRED